MTRVLVTSDHHFGHGRIAKLCGRPFLNVGHMDRVMVDLWNEAVEDDDHLWHLGDFCLKNAQGAREYFEQLNGHIHVLANPWHHDHKWLGGRRITPTYTGSYAQMPEMVSKSGHIVILEAPLMVIEYRWRERNVPITLCHYPLESWDRQRHGGLHLHGHTHSNQIPTGRAGRFHVGVDATEFAPLVLSELLDKWLRRDR